MSIVHPTSLSDSIDSVAEALFYEKSIPPQLCDELSAFIVSRQIQSGTNSGYFLPYASELRSRSRLFTGETLHTEFANRNLLLIECTRLLILLRHDDPEISRTIRLSHRRMNMLCYSQFCAKGECKALTIAYMRYLTVSTSDDAPGRLDRFLNTLSAHRDGKGKWHGFPFLYTLLMLSEANRPRSADELVYASSNIEKLSGKGRSDEYYSNRCQTVVDKISTRSEHNAYPLLLGQF